MSKQIDKNRNYDILIHKLGRWSTIIMLIALISVPIAMGLFFGIEVEIKKTIIAFFGAFSIFGIIGLIEFFAYAPIIGAGGQYLSSITGNISNMKLPAAVSSVKLSQYEPGSKEAEVISMIAIAISSLVTTIIIFLGMLFIGQLLPLLQSPTLTPAFANLMPALLGALATPFFIKDFKTATVPSLLAAILTLALGYTLVAKIQSFLLPVFLIITVGWSYFLYKRKEKAPDIQMKQ